jgi:glycosyltransferase involved in cell wall biosynthesis
VKPNILFVHAVCPAQFSDLCEYLNTSGAANAYYMTTPGNLERNRHRYSNLLPLTPDGNIMAGNSYYFSGKAERAGRVSVGLHRALQELPDTVELDLIVAHGSWGSPHLIFDELDVPIITYIEFPSYADHGWDERYPPTASQRLADKNMQMLSYYQAMKSELTLVPSEYARRMFPDYLQDRIVARFEGFDPAKIARREPSGVKLPAGVKTLGFAARDLSSAKGLELFIDTAAWLIARHADIHFVIIGDPTSTTYGYEQVFLDQTYGKDSGVTFISHVMTDRGVDPARFTLTGKLPYDQFSDLVHHIDLFMYPVQYGSGNWGLMELLIRGRPVIAANRCYVPEMITNQFNGVLVDTDKPQAWGEAVEVLLHDEQARKSLGENAMASAQAYSLPNVARSYLALFDEVIRNFYDTPQ